VLCVSTGRNIRNRTPSLTFTQRFMLPSLARTLNLVDRVTVQEAAHRLGISQDAVRQRIRRGSLKNERDDRGRVYVYLDPTDTPPTAALHPASHNELLVTELRERNRFLEAELAERREESRRKDHIIAALTQRIPELEPPSEPREYSKRPTEHVDRGSTTKASTTEPRRPRWAFLLGGLVSAVKRVRR
jgi:hypothetical protein